MSTQSSASTLPVAPSASLLPGSRWTPLAVVLAGTFMVVLDFFIVNVALPSMQTELHASVGSIQWVLAGYALSSAVFLITAARLGDRIGRRRTFSIGLAVFTLASAACGAAPTPTALDLARVLQGVGGALMVPNVLSIIGVTYTGADRGRALGAYGLVMGIAALGGQLIGGVLVQANVLGLGWRSCFLINLPIGVAALLLAPRLLGESRGEQRSGLDPLGTVLVTATMTAVVLPLVEGRQLGWPAWSWIVLAGAPLLACALVGHERRLERAGGEPLVPPSMFAERSLRVGLLTQMLFWSGQASFFLVLALYLQRGRGLGPIDSGLAFSVLALPYVLVSSRAPELVARHGRRVVAVGALVLALGHALLLATVADVGVGGSIASLVPAFLLIGAGMGLVIAPLTTIAMSGLRAEQAGAATGALSTMQNLGNALGVAVTGAIFFGALRHGYAQALELSLIELVALLVAVAVLARSLPRGGAVALPARAAPGTAT